VFVIPKKMRAVVYRGVNDLRVESMSVPHIGPHELLVKVAVCGVCPTDIKKIHYGTVKPPRVFGHETAGTIVRTGGKVKGFQAGERVALHHHIPCLKCHDCRHRAFAQCAQYKQTGITAGFEPAGGGYAEYVRVMPFVLPGVVKIPARNSFIEGAMLEPVNTVLKGVERLSLLRGDTVLVAGQGPIGLMFTRLLTLKGFNVLATDLLSSRLELAGQLGAKWLWGANPKTPPSRNDAIENKLAFTPTLSPKERETISSTIGQPRIGDPFERRQVSLPLLGERVGVRASLSLTELSRLRRSRARPQFSSLEKLVENITHGRGLDAAVIAVPSDAVVREAQELLRGGGQILLFSHTRRGEQSSLDLATVCVDEKDLFGSYSADFTLQKEVARLVFSRKLDVRGLITHQFPLEQTAAAVELAAHPADGSLKIVVNQGSGTD
jgi:threonine dehydrogenase-like Zn-dependent dehydrogenase